MKQHCYLLLVLALLAACNKEKTASVNTSLLFNKQWRLDSLYRNEFGLSYEAVTIQSCRKNNTFEYRADGTLILNYDSQKCYAQEPATEKGTWHVDQEKRELHLDLADAQFVYWPKLGTVVKLTETELTLQQVVEGGYGDILMRYHYKAQ